jgi:hypothetical protein
MFAHGYGCDQEMWREVFFAAFFCSAQRLRCAAAIFARAAADSVRRFAGPPG